VEFQVVLAFTHTLIGRSVMVPSSFGRTLWISGASTVPVIIFIAARGMAFVPDAPPPLVRTFVALASIWCLVAVVSAALNSELIFGLRERIREVGKLGQYTLQEKIGEGGMGVVYRATHAMLRRPAAIKLLLPERAGENDLARFEREVQLTSRLAHPNTISIFDYGRTTGGVFYYVMEYLDGFDLQRLVDEDGPLPSARVIHILVQVSGALSEAHTLGLIHRDIKPANIVLTERVDEPDVVKVVDFGLVKTLKRASDDAGVTNVDAIIGTPMYLAPDAITSPDSVDARSDLYALGAVAYFLLTGQHVFDAPTIVEMCSKHLLKVPVPPSQRVGRPIPPDLEALVLACLAKRREDRPESAEALRAALLACADAAKYDVGAARAWWKGRGAELRARAKEKRTAASGATMAIDLRGRYALDRGR
jgi:serine/threonine-protein kinase